MPSATNSAQPDATGPGRGFPGSVLQHGKLALLIAVAAVAVVGLVTGHRVGQAADSVSGYSADIDLFDDSAVHEISLEFDSADWEAMVARYLEDDTKEYIPATITIDGVSIENVGVRLKGNSTLRSSVRSTDADPTDVPLLVKLDEYVTGLSYQGVTELALRTGGPNIRGGANLEEIVGGAVYEAAGLDFPRTTYAGLSINGADATLRVITENPSDEYAADRYGAGDELYKAETGGSFAYRGDDPAAYEDSFSLQSSGDDDDLAPLIEFLAWADGATDEEFGAELDEWLDVETFADYLAVSNLLVNVDSLAGTGHNYYLWYDEDEGRFTVLAWDLNESFGGFWFSEDPNTELLPDWSNATRTGAGGFAPEGRGVGPADGEIAPLDGTGSPNGMAPGERPAGAGDGFLPGGQTPGGAGGGLDFNNLLRERFLADDGFAALYEERYAALYEELLASGLVTDLVADYASVLEQAVAMGLIEERQVQQATTDLLTFLEQRTAFLADLVG